MEYAVKPFTIPFQFYEWIMSKSDPRTSNFPLCGTPFPVLSLIFCYVYFVKVLGPQWMKNRPPFKIEKLVVLYDALMVVFSTFFFLYGGSYTYLRPWGKYSWLCEPVNYGSDPDTLAFVSLTWWFFVLRIFDFVDTIFFVLRKKFTRITVLHVIHHTTVVWGIWIGLNFAAGGHGVFAFLINCFVHIIMYSYYFLAALGPRVRKYLWWKKYLTMLQMVQFVINIVHASFPLFYDCGFQKGFALFIMFNDLLYLVLFLNFYLHTFSHSRKTSASSTDSHSLQSNETTIYGNHQPNEVHLKRRHDTIIREDRQSESIIRNGAMSAKDQ